MFLSKMTKLILKRETEPIRPEYDGNKQPNKDDQEDSTAATAHAGAAAVSKTALEPAIDFVQKEQFEQS